MKLDINPISEDRITLEEYMIDAEKYLDEKEEGRNCNNDTKKI